MTGNNQLRFRQWPKELEDELKVRWASGDSASIIGADFGLSRCSIIGKVFRMKLPQRPLRKSKPRNRALAKPAKPRFNFAYGRVPKEPPKSPSMPVALKDIVPLNGEGVTLLERHSDQCHAVIFMPNDYRSRELARYCGNPTYGGFAYCEGHYNAFHQAPKERIR